MRSLLHRVQFGVTVTGELDVVTDSSQYILRGEWNPRSSVLSFTRRPLLDDSMAWSLGVGLRIRPDVTFSL